VPENITKEAILEKLEILNASLEKDFGIKRPKIAVLSLNPHAGDDGLIGTEEIDVIIPTLKEARDKSIMALGPFPADGFFGSDDYNKFDAILAMYHDQGLAPFKALAFESGVNFTAGLSGVRTSPAHGTAYSIAGNNTASETSFREALYLAIDVFKNRLMHEEINKDPLKTAENVKNLQ
jgi:4-hydroxythreonine-4-phosphate dehydrogenase